MFLYFSILGLGSIPPIWISKFSFSNNGIISGNVINENDTNSYTEDDYLYGIDLYELSNVTVSHNSQLDGEKVQNIDFPYNSKIIKIKRNDHEFLPHGEITLLPGDQLQIGSDEGFISHVNRNIRKLNEPK